VKFLSEVTKQVRSRRNIALMMVLVACFVGYPVFVYALTPSDHIRVTARAAQKLGFARGSIENLVRGAVMPDFDNYDNPAAHAQTPNDELGRPTQTAAEAAKKCEEYFTERGRQFRLALRQKHTPAALYTLGYAMHSLEDASAHQGMNNVDHAVLNLQGSSPDKDAQNILRAEKWSEDLFNAVHANLSDEEWRQLQTSPSVSSDDEWFVAASRSTVTSEFTQAQRDEIGWDTVATSPNHPEVGLTGLARIAWFYSHFYESGDLYSGQLNPLAAEQQRARGDGEFHPQSLPEDFRVRWAHSEQELEEVKERLIKCFVTGANMASNSSVEPNPPTGLTASVQ
jgi:hypothetical protein